MNKDGTWAPGAWTPVRDGDYYCSPACCGDSPSRCTWAAYEAVVERASEVCRELGPGWAPAPHENLGWYCRVRNGPISLSVPGHGGTSYRQFGVSIQGHGVIAKADTAQEALAYAARILKARVDAAQSLLDQVESVL